MKRLTVVGDATSATGVVAFLHRVIDFARTSGNYTPTGSILYMQNMCLDYKSSDLESRLVENGLVNTTALAIQFGEFSTSSAFYNNNGTNDHNDDRRHRREVTAVAELMQYFSIKSTRSVKPPGHDRKLCTTFVVVRTSNKFRCYLGIRKSDHGDYESRLRRLRRVVYRECGHNTFTELPFLVVPPVRSRGFADEFTRLSVTTWFHRAFGLLAFADFRLWVSDAFESTRKRFCADGNFVSDDDDRQPNDNSVNANDPMVIHRLLAEFRYCRDFDLLTEKLHDYFRMKIKKIDTVCGNPTTDGLTLRRITVDAGVSRNLRLFVIVGNKTQYDLTVSTGQLSRVKTLFTKLLTCLQTSTAAGDTVPMNLRMEIVRYIRRFV